MNPTDPNTFWLQQGFLGAIIFSLLSTFIPLVIFLYKKCETVTKEKDAEIKALNTALNVLQEKRVSEYAGITASFSKLGESLVTSDEAIQKSVDSIIPMIQSIK